LFSISVMQYMKIFMNRMAISGSIIECYMGKIELICDLKRRSVEGLVDLFPNWWNSRNIFDEDVALEVQGTAEEYLDSYFCIQLVLPVMITMLCSICLRSDSFQSLLSCFSGGAPIRRKLKRIVEYHRVFQKLPIGT